MDEPFAKGKRGLAFIEERDGKKILIKKVNPKSDAHLTLVKEADFLKKLNKEGIGPTFISLEKDALVREFADGEEIGVFLENKNHGKEDIVKVLKDVFEQCRTMDEMQINKQEMTNPYKHVIIDDKLNSVMIDFERCRYTEKPKNVTQFCQYVTSLNIVPLLAERGIKIDKDEIIELSKKYKDSMSDEDYKKIIELIC